MGCCGGKTENTPRRGSRAGGRGSAHGNKQDADFYYDPHVSYTPTHADKPMDPSPPPSSSFHIAGMGCFNRAEERADLTIGSGCPRVGFRRAWAWAEQVRVCACAHVWVCGCPWSVCVDVRGDPHPLPLGAMAPAAPGAAGSEARAPACARAPGLTLRCRSRQAGQRAFNGHG